MLIGVIALLLGILMLVLLVILALGMIYARLCLLHAEAVRLRAWVRMESDPFSTENDPQPPRWVNEYRREQQGE
jgi:hypothetical protein